MLSLISLCLDAVKVAEWPSYGKELLIRLTVCWRVMSICNSGCWFRGREVPIAPVPGGCLPFYLIAIK